MKKFKFIIACAAVVAGLASAVSCQDLSKEVDALTKDVASLKTQLADLQKAIDEGAILKSVSSKDGVLTIVTSTGTYTIKDGKDGKDADVWTIGTDGYWYKNDKKSEWKAVGEPGQPGNPGNPGTPGTTGPAGTPGDYYKPNEETGCFDRYSWDAEAGAYVLAEETDIRFAAEDAVSVVWDEDSDSLIVVDEDGEFSKLALTRDLKSLEFVATNPYDAETYGVGTFDVLPVAKFYMLKGTHVGAAGVLTADVLASNKPIFSYRVNPANADIDEDLVDILNRKAIMTRASGDNDDIIDFNGLWDENPVLDIEPEDGEIFVELQVVHGTTAASYKTLAPRAAANTQAAEDQFALTYEPNEDEEIVSNLALARNIQDLEVFFPYNEKDLLVAKKTNAALTPNDAPYKYYVAAQAGLLNKWTKAQGVTDAKVKADVALDAAANLEMAYNNAAGIDLDDYLQTWADEIDENLPDIYAEPTYVVKKVDEYIGADNQTNQQVFIDYDEDTKIVKVKDIYGAAAINRTPVFKIQVNYEGLILAEAYAKLNITPVEPVVAGVAAQDSYSESVKYEAIPDVTFGETGDGKDIKYNWDTFNQKVLKVLNLSYQEFFGKYKNDDVKIEYFVKDATVAAAAAPAGVLGTANFFAAADNDINTTLIKVNITDQVEENTYGKVVFTINPKDENKYTNGPVKITINYTVTHNHTWWPLSTNYLWTGRSNAPRETVVTKGKLVGGKWQMRTDLNEHFKDYFQGYATAEGYIHEMTDNHSYIYFQLPDSCANEQTYSTWGNPCTTGTHVLWSQTNADAANHRVPVAKLFTDADVAQPDVNKLGYITLGDYLQTPHMYYTLNEYQVLDNGNFCEKLYDVMFQNPFTMTAPNIVLPTTIQAQKYDILAVVAATADNLKIQIKETISNKLVYATGNVKTNVAANQAMFGGLTFGDGDGELEGWKVELVFLPGDNAEVEFNNAGQDPHLYLENGDAPCAAVAGRLVWDNGGTALAKDLKCHYKVSVNIKSGDNKLSVVEAMGSITCPKNI